MLKNKKGIAIETAVFMMIIIFALCTLIVTITLYSRQHVERSKNDFAEQVEIDQIGEQFIGTLHGTIGSIEYEGYYTIEDVDNYHILTVYDDNGKVILNVVAETSNNAGTINKTVNIKRWSCFEEVSATPADPGE